MRKSAAVLFVTLLVAAASVSVSATATSDKSSPSIEHLVKRLVSALNAESDTSLHALRVSKQQYLGVIVPGTVDPGNEPRKVSEKVADFFWSMLDQKSQDYGHTLMQRYGGKALQPGEFRFSKEHRTYAGYEAFGELRLDAVSEDGTKYEIRSGWIAAINGEYKFIGFEWDE